MKHRIHGLALAIFCTAGVAQARVEVIYEGIQSTLISGTIGTDQTIKEPGHDAFLLGIEFGEVHDEPCYLELIWWRYNESYSDRDQGKFSTQFDVCDDGPRAFADKFLELDNFARDKLRAIHAIKIGVNNTNGRLKGAKIYGSYINRQGDGAVEREPAFQEEFTRANFHHWESKQSCPSGQVAVRVIVEYNADEIVGLGLDCAVPEVWELMDQAFRPPDL